MSDHLTERQLSTWLAGRSTPGQQQHVRECPQCSDAVSSFLGPISTFQSAMQDWSNRQDLPRFTEGLASPQPRRRIIDPRWGWAVAAAAVVILTAIPLYRQGSELQRSAKAAEAAQVMDTVNQHLSRTVPAPMEPIMALIPINEYLIQTGGIQ
jgi:hypothetical protein